MSRRNKRTYLWDIQDAARNIQTFVAGKIFEVYQTDLILRRAVEREFMIVGEALNQAQQRFPELKEEIADYAKIIGFRNRLIHAYFGIDDETVWGVIELALPSLITEVDALLEGSNEA